MSKHNGKNKPINYDNSIIIVVMPNIRKDVPHCSSSKSDNDKWLIRTAVAEAIAPLNSNNDADGDADCDFAA